MQKLAKIAALLFMVVFVAMYQYTLSLDEIVLDRYGNAAVVADAAGGALGIVGLAGNTYNVDDETKTLIGGIANNTVLNSDLYATAYLNVTRARKRTLIILPSNAAWTFKVWIGDESVTFSGVGAASNLHEEFGPVYIPKMNLVNISVEVDVEGYTGLGAAYAFEGKLMFDFAGFGEDSLYFELTDMPYPRHCYVNSSEGTLEL